MRPATCLNSFSLLLLTGVISCSLGGPTAPTTSTTGDKDFADAFPENRGELLPISEITTNSMIRWEDPAEIVYFTERNSVTPRLTYIRALRLSDNTTRTLHTGGNSGGYLGYHGLFVSPDGKQFFASLYRSPGGDSDMYQIVPSAASVQIAPGTKVGTLIPTPDSRGAVYVAYPDSIGYYDVATRTSRLVGVGCRTPLALSPDGKNLLCEFGSGAATMSMADGTMQMVSSPGFGIPMSYHWDGHGIQVAYSFMAPGNELILRNRTTSIDTTLIKPYQLRVWESAFYYKLAWSRDGRKIAFPSQRFEPLATFPGELVIYVVDVETGALSHVASMRVSAGSNMAIEKIVFSPDCRSLAYLVGTSTYAEAYRATVQ